MSDPKRTPLISINAGKKDKSRKVLEKTIRFNVTLPESTEEEYPEFDYNVMLRSAEKKQAIKKKRTEAANGHGNGIQDSDDDQEAMKEIARHFEQKYGGKTRIQNLSELGAGYDESDSFIDNSEAVDEALSENVTTQYGGFYINCGALELKNIKPQSDDDTDSVHGNNKKYKRLLNTIEEESDSDDNEKSTSSSPAGSAPSITNNGDHPKVPTKKDMISSGNGEESWRKKRKLLTNSSDQLNKKRATEPIEDQSAKTVKELLREKREKQGQRTTQETVKESIDDAIESVVNASRAHHKQTKEAAAAVSNSLSSTSSAAKTTLTVSSNPTTPATSFITQQSSAQNITTIIPSNNSSPLEPTKIKSSIKSSNSETKSISNSIAVTSQSSVSSTSITTPTIISSSKTSMATIVKTTQASTLNSLATGKVAQPPPSSSNPSPNTKFQPQPVITAAPGKVAQQASVNIPQTGKAAGVATPTTLNSHVGKIAQAPTITATSMISQSSTASSDDDSDSSSSSSDSSSSCSDESGDEKETEEKEQNTVKEDAPKPASPVNAPLPNGLSEDIIKLVDSLKEVAPQSNEGKFKFFNAKVNQILLDLEKRTRNLPTSIRAEIFGHSSQFTPCTKETLARRAKKLHVQSLETRISSTITKLQESVSTLKSSVLSNYSKLCMKLAEEKSITCPNNQFIEPNVPRTIGDGGGTEIPNDIMANLPPKKFPWSNELRRHIDIIIKLKSQTFDKTKPRKLQQLLKMYLETEIKPIWPTGWMSVNELMEEARKYKPMPSKQNKTKLTTNSNEPEITEILSSKEITINSSWSLKKESMAEIHSFPTDLSRNHTKSLSNSTKSTKSHPKVELAQSKPLEKPGIASQANKSNNLVNNSESKQFIPPVKHTKQNAHERTESSPQVAKRPKIDTPISSNSLQIEQVFLPQVENIKKLKSEPESVASDPLSLDIPSLKPDPDSSFTHVIEPVSHHINVSKHLKLKSDLEIHASKSKSKTPPALSPSVSISPVTIRDTNSTYSRPPTTNQQNNHHRSHIRVKSPGSISKASDLIMVPSNRAAPEHGVIQKTPSTLTMVNIPDCISITPSQPIQSQASHSIQSPSPSTRPMSLKHRILQETALSRLENDGIEVIEIHNEKKSLAKSQIKTPPPQNQQLQQQQLPPQQHSQRLNIPKQSKTKIHKTERKSSSSPQSPIQTKNRSNVNEIEETAAATNLLSQMINESIIYNDNDKLVQELSQTTSLPLKEEIKPKEDPVQLEVDRVMKELMELQGKAEREKSPEVLEVSHSRNSDLDKLTLRSDLYLRNDFPDEFHKHLFPEKSPRASTTNSLLGSPPRPRNRPELPTTHISQPSPYFHQSSPSTEPFSLSLGPRMNHSAPPAHMNDIKSEQGTLPDFISNIPTGDDPFSLPQFFQPFGQSFSGSNQHSSPY